MQWEKVAKFILTGRKKKHDAWEEWDEGERPGKGFKLWTENGGCSKWWLEYDNEETNEDFLAEASENISDYVEKTSGIYEVYLKIEDPMEIDAKGAHWEEIPYGEDEDGKPMTESIWRISKEARDMGCDGLIVRDVFDTGKYGSGGESGDVYVVFKPTQIKSVHNRGTFSSTDSDIRKNPRR